jgi:two-component system, LytTR family, sensor histidine kinase AlgZ
MRSIIRQNGISPTLPDFRNLGTILRILVAVNGAVAVAALLRNPSLRTWPLAWTDMVAVAEPQLLVMLAALYVLQPWLVRQTYSLGVTVLLAMTALAGVGVYALLGRNELPPEPGGMLRNVVLGLLTTWGLIEYFQLRARALSPAITEARLQALQARIRPHFLFNSINAVLSLMRTDPKRAETSLEDMADLFRVLMRDNRGLAPLADEVELCRQYLALEKLRLGERLVVEWHTNNMPADAMVPPLILQPLLENAVYHGIEPLTEPGIVSVNIFYKGGDVHAILRNPYRVTGGQHHAGNKMAMANVRERLALHFDAEATLESRVKADAYEVHLRIPYRTEKSAAVHGDVALRRDAATAPAADPKAPLRRGMAHG